MQENLNSATSGSAGTAKKNTRRHIPLPTAEELAAFPFIKSMPKATPKAAEFNYFATFGIPVTGVLGTVTEANNIHEFAIQLDATAKEKSLGYVSSVGCNSGQFEVELTVNVAEKQTVHSAPVANALTQLKGFLETASVLKGLVEGKPASWKAKVNGTTLYEDNF